MIHVALPNIYVENGTLPYYATRDEVFHVYCCTSRSPKARVRWEFSKRPYFPHENDSQLTVYEMVRNHNYPHSNLQSSNKYQH